MNSIMKPPAGKGRPSRGRHRRYRTSSPLAKISTLLMPPAIKRTSSLRPYNNPSSSSSTSQEMKLALLFLLLGGAALEAAPLLHPADFVALQSLRRSLRDFPGSKFFSSWDFTADPCDFSGVLCRGDRVVALRLGEPRAGSPGLVGRLDPSLGRLSALTQLSLAPGRVAGPIPSSISQLSELRFLGLSRNLLSGQIPPEISSLRLLQTLDLSFNLLSGTIPRELHRLPFLANLVLGHNQISGSVPNFSKCSSLLRLDLKRNNLSGEIPAMPPSLRYLSLSSNRLSGSIGRTIPSLRELRYLDLGRNRLAGKIPPAVFTLPATHLRLQRNMFSGPALPAETVEIPIVDLSFNRLSGEVSPMFSSVKRLYLNNNLLTGKVPESLVEGLKNSSISELFLHHNFLNGMESNLTSEIPISNSLCLRYNCMIPPAGTDCPLAAAAERIRPPGRCSGGKPEEEP